MSNLIQLSEEEATVLFYEYLDSINGTGMNEPTEIIPNRDRTGWEFHNINGLLATVLDTGEVNVL